LKDAYQNDMAFWSSRVAADPTKEVLAQSPVLRFDDAVNIDQSGTSEVSKIVGQLTTAGAEQLFARGRYFGKTVLAQWLSSLPNGKVHMTAQSSNYTRTQRSVQEFLSGLRAANDAFGSLCLVTVAPAHQCPLAAFESGLPLAQQSRQVLKRFSQRQTSPEVTQARDKLIAAIPYFQPDAGHNDHTSLHPDASQSVHSAELVWPWMQDPAESSDEDDVSATPGTSEADAAVTGHKPAAADSSAKGSLAAFKRRFLWIRAADSLHAAKSHGFFDALPEQVQEAERVTSEHCLERFLHMYDDPACRRFAVAPTLQCLVRAISGKKGSFDPDLTLLSAHDVTLLPVFRALLPHQQRNSSAVGWPGYSSAVTVSAFRDGGERPDESSDADGAALSVVQQGSNAEAASRLGSQWMREAVMAMGGEANPADAAKAIRIACGMLGADSDLESVAAGHDLVKDVVAGTSTWGTMRKGLLFDALADIRQGRLPDDTGLSVHAVMDAPSAAILSLPHSPLPPGHIAGGAAAQVWVSMSSFRVLAGAAASGCPDTWQTAQNAVWNDGSGRV
jgi:hypothetical protein